MKAILVIDMPDVCVSAGKQCDLFVENDWGFLCAPLAKEVKWSEIPDWCPLHPLPERRDTNSIIKLRHEAKVNGVTEEHQAEFNLGWNACLDKITGEVEV